jgi:hypothetical protein
MPFLVLVRGAFVNAGGTARFNPQISRQMSWVRVYRKRIEGYFAASASFEKKSVLFKVLDTDFITSIATLIAPCLAKDLSNYALQVPRTRMRDPANSP